jgi:hypothetical protein
MSLDTRKHIDSMIQTSLALEAEARANGRYSKDCSRVNDAIARGQKSGVALLWDAAGRLEIVDLNGGSERVHVTDEGEHVSIEHNFEGQSKQRKEETSRVVAEAAEEPYTQMNGEEWEKAKAKSHEPGAKVAGKVAPVNTTDAALVAKRKAMTADAKRFTAASIKRNEEIAARQKAFWNNKGA